ncbi:MAG: tRNA (adenosine(37)-N6)-threonylcarbamoyltransferase complex ATPase subunit type 1 TsaE [Solirubrobacterales bacterium]|nr:tRNA (adenosine(37)-N6)-threonylcarbamoyltransferase complex ATPase subunit type 1 TsaE [Solirubrobacterales bacterium]
MEFPEADRVVRGPAAMEREGADLARRLRAGDVVMLRGEVGAGKSTMIRAALRQLGVEGPIPSPTFTVGRIYPAMAGSTVVPDGVEAFAHLDLHRLGDIEEEDPGLLTGYFGRDRITFVEWAEGREHWLAGLADRLIEVRIGHRDEESRFLGPALPALESS